MDLSLVLASCQSLGRATPWGLGMVARVRINYDLPSSLVSHDL